MNRRKKRRKREAKKAVPYIEPVPFNVPMRTENTFFHPLTESATRTKNKEQQRPTIIWWFAFYMIQILYFFWVSCFVIYLLISFSLWFIYELKFVQIRLITWLTMKIWRKIEKWLTDENHLKVTAFIFIHFIENNGINKR